MFRLISRFASALLAASLTLGMVSAARADDLELISVNKIWDAAPHNAFTDLVRYQDQWVCGFREAPAHAGGVKDSKIRLLASTDGESWRSLGTLQDSRGDIRDAKFGLMPDGRLMVLTAIQLFDTSQQKHQSLVWFTNDLKTFDGPHDVGDPDLWTWGITFHKGVGYSIGYRTVEPRFARLYKTQNGKQFETVVEDLGIKNPYPNESVIAFGEDDMAYCLLRCSGPAQIGTAKPPYTDWTWKELGAAVGGPEMIRLANGRLLGGGRLYDGKVRTSLFWVDPESAQIRETLELPSGGDTSYPGMVVHEGTLHVSYYASHEGKSSIYFAKVKLPEEATGDVAKATGDAVEIGTRLEPFVDDFLVASFSGGAELELHQPVEREIVISHDQPWEGNTSTYHTVFDDGEKYRMYYRGHHMAEHGSGKIENHEEVVCYAESDDGIHWTKPNLGLFEFNGSKNNNIVWAKQAGVHNFAPFLDTNPEAAPEAKYKAIGRHRGGLYVFRSPDAIHWELIEDKPVITKGAFDSLNIAFYDSHRNRYVDFHRGFRNGVRDIMTTVSQDFVNWSEPEWLAYTGAPPEHLYTNGIVAYHRAPHVFVGLPKRYVPGRNPSNHPARGVSDAVFMSSRDGKTFHRWPEAIVRPGLVDSRWVNRNNLPAWGIVETESSLPGAPNELSIYTTEGYYTGDSCQLRRHTWRLDGFVSLSAPYEGGEVLTRPVVFGTGTGDASGEIALNLNVSTSAAGSVQVELLQDGEPAAGFTLSDCDAVVGDSIEKTVSWGGRTDLSALAGQPVQLRFKLTDADVYAMQFVAAD